jgi:WD40 repeat protein
MQVGGGSTRAKVFMWDTGSNLAEIIPHNKKNLTGDIKSTRPFKLAMGGEDFNMSFYGGPPFKYEKGLKEHSNFVNCVRYAPDGSRFASVSSDKLGVIYDGTTGDVIGKLDQTAGACHSGSILSCAWSPDSKSLATASADKTVRVWDVSGAGPSFPCTATYAVGKGAVDDMQHAIVWPRADLAISVSLVRVHAL